jgi:tetratricopeptide (TPR) repeat protein
MAESHREEIAKLEALYAGNPGGRVFVHLAEALRRAGDLERARSILEEGLARHTDSASGFVVLGRVLADLADGDGAESAFRRVQELDGGNLVALRGLGDLALAGGRSHEAAGFYRELLARSPSNTEVRELLEGIEAAADDRPAPRTEAPADAGAAVDAMADAADALRAGASEAADEQGGEPIAPFSTAPGETGGTAAAQPEFGAMAAESLPGDSAALAGDAGAPPAGADEAEQDLADLDWDEFSEPQPDIESLFEAPRDGAPTSADAFDTIDGEFAAEPLQLDAVEAEAEAEVSLAGDESATFAADRADADDDEVALLHGSEGDDFGADDFEAGDFAAADFRGGGLDATVAERAGDDAGADGLPAYAFEADESDAEAGGGDDFEGLPQLAGDENESAASPGGADESADAPDWELGAAAETPGAADDDAAAADMVEAVPESGIDAGGFAGALGGPAAVDAGEERGLQTETMGDLYRAQGFHDRAAEVYRALLARRPDDPALKAKLEAAEAAAGAVPAVESLVEEDESGEVWLRDAGTSWTGGATAEGGAATPYAWTDAVPDAATDTATDAAESAAPIGDYLRSLVAWQPPADGQPAAEPTSADTAPTGPDRGDDPRPAAEP